MNYDKHEQYMYFEFHRQMARRFGRYAVLLLHTTRAHTS